ncbi:MAG: type IV secretion system DNA-binding domain-containing protein [Patescibacteria group bacterium]|nr:type IV secretion system DNA-binding domain-containing protein [Patescibacteria group bacterium]MDE2015748.1 type IV secretion system DNA-binding domain-containing protein [Patescibacteria group bacterium]MDE2226805.1 type IV secretion system DNA-binding domain-containing protein [Patescibacteria group bacterium]
MNDKKNTELTPLGFCNFRNQKTRFGIKTDDRRRHIYVVGKTGVGKTTMMENMIVADIRAGRGVGVVDPHGELAEKIVEFVPEERLDDVIYFNPADMDYPIAFNPIEQVGTEFRHLVASGIMGVFKKIWPDVWSARMEYILNNTLLALLEYPSSTLLGVIRMLSEPAYRKKIVDNLKDPVIKAFWVNEFARYTQRLETEAVAAIQNKVGQFVSNPLIRNILGQAHSTLNMREIMDNKKIFIVNLSKGKIGEDNSALLGAMVITRLQLAAMSRVDLPEEQRNDFFLYVDEFQNFATESFANILSEARKYRLSLTLAHQYIGQLVNEQNTKVRDAVFGNVGTLICFRTGGADAEFLEKEFMPEFIQNDLVNLAKATIYIKLMIDGVASRPFSAETLPPQKIPLISHKDVIIQNSRTRYSTPRKIVDEKIAEEWQAASETIVGGKIDRQGERPLRQTLQDGNNQSFRPRPDRRPSDSARYERTGDMGNNPGRRDGFDNRDRDRRSPYDQRDYRPQQQQQYGYNNSSTPQYRPQMSPTPHPTQPVPSVPRIPERPLNTDQSPTQSFKEKGTSIHPPSVPAAREDPNVLGRPHPQEFKPKVPKKPDIDIAGLREAIKQSLVIEKKEPQIGNVVIVMSNQEEKNSRESSVPHTNGEQKESRSHDYDRENKTPAVEAINKVIHVNETKSTEEKIVSVKDFRARISPQNIGSNRPPTEEARPSIQNDKTGSFAEHSGSYIRHESNGFSPKNLSEENNRTKTTSYYDAVDGRDMDTEKENSKTKFSEEKIMPETYSRSPNLPHTIGDTEFRANELEIDTVTHANGTILPEKKKISLEDDQEKSALYGTDEDRDDFVEEESLEELAEKEEGDGGSSDLSGEDSSTDGSNE